MTCGSEMLMTRAAAADYLGLRERSVYELVRQGKLPAIRVGRVWRFRRADLDAWQRAHTTASPEPEPPDLLAPPVDLRALDGNEQALLGAVLAELREVRHAVVRVGNRLAGGAR